MIGLVELVISEGLYPTFYNIVTAVFERIGSLPSPRSILSYQQELMASTSATIEDLPDEASLGSGSDTERTALLDELASLKADNATQQKAIDELRETSRKEMAEELLKVQAEAEAREKQARMDLEARFAVLNEQIQQERKAREVAERKLKEGQRGNRHDTRSTDISSEIARVSKEHHSRFINTFSALYSKAHSTSHHPTDPSDHHDPQQTLALPAPKFPPKLIDMISNLANSDSPPEKADFALFQDLLATIQPPPDKGKIGGTSSRTRLTSSSHANPGTSVVVSRGKPQPYSGGGNTMVGFRGMLISGRIYDCN